MNYTFTGKNFTISDALREKVSEKMRFLSKYLIIDSTTECHVTISEERNIYKIELIVFSKVGILKSEEKDKDLNMALEICVNKLEKQITRNKQRLNRNRKAGLAEAFIDNDEVISKSDVLVRTKSITPEPMDLEEAILQMEMLGHSFFVYLDQENERYAIVYKRINGGYGLIEIDE